MRKALEKRAKAQAWAQRKVFGGEMLLGGRRKEESGLTIGPIGGGGHFREGRGILERGGHFREGGGVKRRERGQRYLELDVDPRRDDDASPDQGGA